MSERHRHSHMGHQMASILTNTSAMVALTSLRDINSAANLAPAALSSAKSSAAQQAATKVDSAPTGIQPPASAELDKVLLQMGGGDDALFGPHLVQEAGLPAAGESAQFDLILSASVDEVSTLAASASAASMAVAMAASMAAVTSAAPLSLQDIEAPSMAIGNDAPVHALELLA